MSIQFTVAKPSPHYPDKLMQITNIQILGACLIDEVSFAVLSSNYGIIGFSLKSGFFYPLKARWKAYQRMMIDHPDVPKAYVDGEDVGEIIKCGFNLGRDEGQKRLRTVLEIPEGRKILILSGGGIRVKDSSGCNITSLSLLEGMRMNFVNDDYVRQVAQNWTHQTFLSKDPFDKFIELAHDWVIEEKESSCLFNVIKNSDCDDGGLVEKVRESENSKFLNKRTITRTQDGPGR